MDANWIPASIAGLGGRHERSAAASADGSGRGEAPRNGARPPPPFGSDGLGEVSGRGPAGDGESQLPMTSVRASEVPKGYE